MVLGRVKIGRFMRRDSSRIPHRMAAAPHSGQSTGQRLLYDSDDRLLSMSSLCQILSPPNSLHSGVSRHAGCSTLVQGLLIGKILIYLGYYESWLILTDVQWVKFEPLCTGKANNRRLRTCS